MTASPPSWRRRVLPLSATCQGICRVTELPPRNPTVSEKLQILSTEHWSLIAARALTYQESLGRVSMFLGVLSGSVIALALIAQVDLFGTTFVAVAIFMLAVVFFIGVATIRRLQMLNLDDYTWVVGMNRLRNAYLELHPDLEPNFIPSQYDDLAGNLKTLGLAPSSAPLLGTVFHGFITLPGMLGVIVAAVGAAIAGLAASGLGAGAEAGLLAGVVGLAAVVAVVVHPGRPSFRRHGPRIQAPFPNPKGESGLPPGG